MIFPLRQDLIDAEMTFIHSFNENHCNIFKGGWGWISLKFTSNDEDIKKI